MTTNMIVATGSDGSIGRDGDLAFHISADLRRFKALTTGHTVIMGRRTFESLPGGALPRRRNIVISSRPGYEAPGAETATSPGEALAMAADGTDDEVFIIGGATVYAAMMSQATRLYITEIDAPCPGADTFFPPVDPARWRRDEVSETFTDEKTGLCYRFVTYLAD